MQQTIIIQGKPVPYEFVSVPIDKCDLDPSNPRIQYLLGQRGGTVNQNELDDLIWSKDAVKALAASIYQNGGVYDPMLVQRKGKRFLVREGNCRTVASKHLLEQYPDDSRFLTAPAMIFDVDLSNEDLAVLLADMHVAGKIQWDAYEQAKHVHDLFHSYGKTYDWLSNHLRLGKSKIVELLLSYQATKDFLTVHPTPGNVKKFTFFHELVKKKELRVRFNEDLQFKQKFHQWLLDGRITDSKQVRNLPAILNNQEATKALDKHGVEEATKVLMRNDPALEGGLFWAVKHATEQLKEAPASDLHDLKAGNAQKLILLRNLHRAIEDMATLAGVKL